QALGSRLWAIGSGLWDTGSGLSALILGDLPTGGDACHSIESHFSSNVGGGIGLSRFREGTRHRTAARSRVGGA
ncbi:MAG TPA: hypothetical protein VK657_07890, partial [Terriglobales bacterium]|nr:hypothetical protein [Terriglobales bacterium]